MPGLKALFCLLFCLLLTGCLGSEEDAAEAGPSINGLWMFDSRDCDGEKSSVGLGSTVSISYSQFASVLFKSNYGEPQCDIRMEASISKTAELATFTYEKSACTPSACASTCGTVTSPDSFHYSLDEAASPVQLKLEVQNSKDCKKEVYTLFRLAD